MTSKRSRISCTLDHGSMYSIGGYLRWLVEGYTIGVPMCPARRGCVDNGIFIALLDEIVAATAR